MVMIVIIVMTVTVPVVVRMTVMMAMIVDVCIVFVGANTFDMMVVTFLRQADFSLETKNLFTIFAHLAIHISGPFLNLNHPIDEGLQDQRLRIEVGGLDEFNFGMPRRNSVGIVVDAFHEHAGKKEIGKDDDPFEAEFRRLLQAGARPRGM